MSHLRRPILLLTAAILLIGSGAALAADHPKNAAKKAPPGIPEPTQNIPAPPQPFTTSISSGDGATQRRVTNSKKWTNAIKDAKKRPIHEQIPPRPVALIIGLSWLLIVLRHRKQQRSLLKRAL